jgi:hypothetical protein
VQSLVLVLEVVFGAVVIGGPVSGVGQDVCVIVGISSEAALSMVRPCPDVVELVDVDVSCALVDEEVSPTGSSSSSGTSGSWISPLFSKLSSSPASWTKPPRSGRRSSVIGSSIQSRSGKPAALKLSMTLYCCPEFIVHASPSEVVIEVVVVGWRLQPMVC